jgi:hypothetical protein
MIDDNNRYPRDDLIPQLRDDGVADTIKPWLKFNISEGFLIEAIEHLHGPTLQSAQLKQLIADLVLIGDLDGAVSSVEPITRTTAPTGLGCTHAGNVWCTPPGEGTVLRFYVNGTFKTSTVIIYENGTPASGYLVTLDSIGAITSDTIQICQVVAGVPGWRTKIKVP